MVTHYTSMYTCHGQRLYLSSVMAEECVFIWINMFHIIYICSVGAHVWTQASGVTEWSLKIIVLGLNSHWTTLVIYYSLLVTECQAQLCKPPFVLKLLGCKCVWIASFIIQLTELLLYPIILDQITHATTSCILVQVCIVGRLDGESHQNYDHGDGVKFWNTS